MTSKSHSMVCPHCERRLRFPDSAIGKTAPCPGCGNRLSIALPEEAPPIRCPPPIPQVRAPEVVVSPPAAPPRIAHPLPVAQAVVPPPPIPTNPFFDPSPTPGVRVPDNRMPARAASKSHGKLYAIVGGGGLLGLVLLAVLAFIAVNQTVNGPLQKVIEDDPRNKGIEAKAHYGGFGFSTLVFDLRDVSGTNSRADVFRVLLHYAHAMKDNEHDSVELAFRGKTKFVISGTYFKTLGEEFDFQNPVYTIRTFPENLRTPDGGRAFPVWEGGVLGILKAQMEDFNEFHNQWYLNDMM